MPAPAAPSLPLLLAPLALLAVAMGCHGNGTTPLPPGAVPQVAGTYDYDGTFGHFLRGTVTFEQVGEMVRVVNVTYENANDRPLVGEAMLQGDRLDIVLVPENGDTDFHADVTFVFSADGDNFSVAFSDTNGDSGILGSYLGTRRAP